MKFTYLFIAICILGIASACSSSMEEEIIPSSELSQDDPAISYRNGIMVLGSSDILSEVLQDKFALTNISFTSQQDIIDDLINKEQIHAKSLKKLSDAEYSVAPKHSDLYFSLLQKKFIKVDKFTDGSELYSLNVAMPNYGKILNTDGYFAIQDTIYQITTDKLKMWINGDFENHYVLDKVNETDVTRGIYVIDYSAKVNTAVQTRASFPIINAINQNIAYYSENVAGTARGILSFYDNTTMNFEAGNYNRNIYCRISHQEKLDGRNYSFTAAPFSLRFGYRTVDNFSNDLYVNGTSADAWYTVYLQYRFLNAGKQTQVISKSEDYIQLALILLVGEIYLGDPRHIYVNFGGDTDNYPGTFVYTAHGSQVLTPLLPE